MVVDKETLFSWLANALKDSPIDFLEVYVGDETDDQVYVRFENLPQDVHSIRDIESGEIYKMSVPMILEWLNRDRVDLEGVLKPGVWGLYDETDWRDGLAENGTYEVVAE